MVAMSARRRKSDGESADHRPQVLDAMEAVERIVPHRQLLIEDDDALITREAAGCAKDPAWSVNCEFTVKELTDL